MDNDKFPGAGRSLNSESDKINNMNTLLTLMAQNPSETGRSMPNNNSAVVKNNISGVDLTELSSGQKLAIQAIIDGKNILSTGPAGTGKSYIIEKVKNIFKANGKVVATTSTTGTSAVLIEGSTIHSWSGTGVCQSNDAALKRVMTYRKPQIRISTVDLLIIDEISMMSGTLLDVLDHVFKHVRRNNSPFGGIQIVFSGDFFQLRPVKSNKYAFEAECWKTLVNEVHELSDIYRQEDVEFCTALNEIRKGEVSLKTIELLSKCVGKEFQGDIKPTHLFPRKDDVSQLNEYELWELASEDNMVNEFLAEDTIVEKPKPRRPQSKKFVMECKARLNKDCIAPEILQLCKGAQVMLITNLDIEAGLANGSRGVVIDFGPHKEPIVKFRNNIVMNIQTHLWNMKINDTTRVRRRQYPLILAYAITIHKSQGCSIDMAKIDLGDNIFEAGMFYTSLSRLRSLEGLSIISINWDQVIVDKKVKEFYNDLKPLK